MTILFLILIILASVILGLIVLIQNPKGGGLAGNIAGFSTQFMGVKQTTDVLEKGTWLFTGIIALLCLLSTFFINHDGSGGSSSNAQDAPAPAQQQAPLPGQSPLPSNTVPMVPVDSNKP